MPDIGDRVPLTLSISTADGTTTATASARLLPDGVPAPLEVTPNAGRDVWTAHLPVTALGAYRITWTVTGTGEGVEHDTVYALGGPDPAAGQSYATLAELAAYLHTTPPEGAAKLLVRASRKVDSFLVGAVYDTDDDGLPTDATVAAALRDATCAQVEYWDETGDTNGTNSAAGWRDVTIGKVRLSRAAGGVGQADTAPPIAPAAEEALRLGGLLPVWAWVYG